MTERHGSSSVGTGTAEIPVLRPAAAAPRPESAAAAQQPESGPVPPVSAAEPATPASDSEAAPPERDLLPGMQPTSPVTVRPKPRMPRRGPLTVMGPWAPVAGGLLGLVLGVVAVVLLAGTADSFQYRLALVFTVLGLGMLGAGGVLLADEVRMMRQRARDAVVRPAWVEATAGLLNGLTPARVLLVISGFVLFLAAYVSR
jgi:hypothetical protein